MKIKDLIIELQKYPEDLEVKTEGCDCWGDVSGVSKIGDEVLITRPD